MDSGEDRGSTPLASRLRSQRGEERRLSRRSLSAEADGLTTHQIVASYGSASQQRQMGSFTYVYILQSESNPSHFYTGRTADLRERLDRHNSGKVPHTTKWKPWRSKPTSHFRTLRVPLISNITSNPRRAERFSKNTSSDRLTVLNNSPKLSKAATPEQA